MRAKQQWNVLEVKLRNDLRVENTQINSNNNNKSRKIKLKLLITK